MNFCSRLPLLACAMLLAAASCAPAPMYRETRRQGPDGSWYIERVRIDPRQSAPRQAAPPDDSWWKGDSMSGKPTMTINLSAQRIYFYKGGQLAGVSTISSGREGFDTPTGKFKIQQKNRDHRSSLYGDYVDAYGQPVQRDVDVRKDPKPPGARFDGAEMRYFMRITGAVGMHEGYLPGFPASHGCIRLPGRMARIFFAETPLGTPVEIVGRAPTRPVQWAPPPPPQPAPFVAAAQPRGESSAAAAWQPAPQQAASSRLARKRADAPPAPRQRPGSPPPRGATLYLE